MPNLLPVVFSRRGVFSGHETQIMSLYAIAQSAGSILTQGLAAELDDLLRLRTGRPRPFSPSHLK